ncbi:DNA helicase [Bacterioplanes sanyensis]|uniref:ATP-dependent helicase n=1 Tax=Bacterioplanes sanyensis TaxID=1249553 RepID=UPI001675C1D9|nr:ATP-dependent helicase [Bacterioplanes sanyensis]GGY45760.1 DNA helicase [Bacterioplanes sanyensis]
MTHSLTPQQQAVVDHRHGHAKVMAVAGSGKTTTLTHFIAARLREGVSPRRLLVLMYNKAAQQEFAHKLSSLLPGQAVPEVRTFHALGLRIYQRLIQQGALPAFQGKPLSNGETEAVVWRLLQQLADEDTRQDILSQRKKWVEPAMAFIDRVKAGLEAPALVFEQLQLPPQCRLFVELFDEFEQWRRQQRRISFADMLYDPVRCLHANPALAAQFAGHMQWILVDEYQDINAIQQCLLELLHGDRGSVMVIGDPDQTIYEFRGSRPEFIVTEFEQRLGSNTGAEVTTYQLPHTFRYGHQLALMANHLIRQNQQRDDVLCLAHSSTPKTQARLHLARSEPALLLKLIEEEAKQRPLESMAVIHRVWALCAPIELALLQAGIPYQLQHSQSVLDRWELQIFWQLFELASGRFAERSVEQRQQAWLQWLTTPYPKVRRPALEALAQKLASVDQSLGEALQQALPGELNKWQAQQLTRRAEVLSSAEHVNVKAHRLVEDYIHATDLYQGMADSAFSAQQIEDRTHTIRAFVRFLRDADIAANQAWDYLQQLRQQRLSQRDGEGIQLTSAHKSKGLEWDVVFIPGLNEHYFPYQPDGEFTTPASLESERRLLYVAMTRARHQLHLLAPAAGNEREQDKRPSRFQAEMRFQHSRALARAIEQRGTAKLVVHEGPALDWWPRYFDAIGVTPELAIDTTPPPQDTVIARKARPEPKGTRVKHQSLGAGILVAEDDNYMRIRFEGEQQDRMFKKTAAMAQLEIER